MVLGHQYDVRVYPKCLVMLPKTDARNLYAGRIQNDEHYNNNNVEREGMFLDSWFGMVRKQLLIAIRHLEGSLRMSLHEFRNR